MNREQLYINNQYVPLTKSINAALTKSITDVENPDKRKATYSKSTRIPNSPEAQEVFGAIFEVNLSDGTFDPTVKADILYKVDGQDILSGYCQLKEIIFRNEVDIDYNLVLFSDLANIFKDMGEEELIELYEFSDTTNELKRWNHLFTKNIQALSWATSVYDNLVASSIPFALGTGYVYPLINYGMTPNLSNFDTTQMSCALYTKEYVDAIFAKHGYTYTSTFFDSTYFKSLIIPSSPRSFQLDETEIADREFSANTTEFQNGTTISDNLNKGMSFTTPEILKFTNELSDAGGNYNPTTGVFTAVNTGYYDFAATVDLSATFTPTTGSSVVMTSSIEGRLEIYVDGTLTSSEPFYIKYDDYPSTYTTGARTTDTSPTITSNQTTEEYLRNTSTFFWEVSNPALESASIRVLNPPNRYQVVLNNVLVTTGTTVDVRWKARYTGLATQNDQMCKDAFNTYYTAEAKLNCSVGSFFSKVVNNSTLVPGNTLKTSKIIPKNVKQKDFFMGLVKMFNLWIDVDPLDNKNLLIEPREDFLGTDVVNIQELWAIDRDTIDKPMGKLDATDYLFTYTPDKDYFNEKYTADWKEVYGQRELKSTNDFVNKQKKIQPIFSPTPLVASPNSDRVMSTIIELDDQNFPKSTEHRIRILYYGGLKNCFDSWNHVEQRLYWPYQYDADTYGTYPYAGHFDDPFNATEDINFGLVKEVYYDDNINQIQVTDNNLVNKYYAIQMQAYTSNNSRIRTGWFNVQPKDFAEWTFDKLYWFDNSYWRLNKIYNYNPTGEELTKCEFLYLETANPVTTEERDIIGDDETYNSNTNWTVGTLDGDETSPIKGTQTKNNPNGNNTSGEGVRVVGEGNYVSPTARFVDIQGDENQVYNEAFNVKITGGDNNIIDAGVYNVTLINTSDLKVEEPNVTYIGGVKVEPGSIGLPSDVEEISADTTYQPDVKAYVVDTSSADITVTFDPTTLDYIEGGIYYIKKDASENQLIIAGGGATIDGDTDITIINEDTTIALMWDGSSKFHIV